MFKSKISSTLLAVGLAAVCFTGVTACTGQNGGEDKTVAATVNGVEIFERDITSTIQTIRDKNGLSDDDAWGKYLSQVGLTPEAVREQIINSYVEEELVKEAISSRGVTVEDSEVEAYVANTRAKFDSDKAWQEALERVGTTEEEYRENIRESLLRNKFIESFASEAEVPTDQLDMYASMYGSGLAGAKRSSHILFAANDMDTAQDVLNRINSGELDFAEAARQYSIDTSASSGGDVGWDKMNNFITEYTSALAQLDKGQVSGLVSSTYGIHIIKCTDVFNPDPSTPVTFAQLPEAFQQTIMSALQNNATQASYQEWLEQQKEAAEIVINDMPSNVSYNIDLSKYQTASSSGATAAASGEASASSASAEAEASSASSGQ